jgi:hypothetical protein
VSITFLSVLKDKNDFDLSLVYYLLKGNRIGKVGYVDHNHQRDKLGEIFFLEPLVPTTVDWFHCHWF